MDPNAEYEHVTTKYPAFGVRVVLVWIALVAVLGILSKLRHVDWWLMGGIACGVIGWEFTKARLRRTAREFAAASQRAV